MAYQVQYDPQAIADLKRISSKSRKRIVDKISWLAENFDQTQPVPLKADLTGFFKLRVGDYRVIYEFYQTVQIIFIDRVGHRREIYG